MSLIISVRDDDVVIELSGVVDVGTSPAVHSVLNDAIGAGFTSLVVDVSRVEVFAADAVGVIIDARRRLVALGGSLRVFGAQEVVRTVFEDTGVAELLGWRAERLKGAAGDRDADLESTGGLR